MGGFERIQVFILLSVGIIWFSAQYAPMKHYVITARAQASVAFPVGQSLAMDYGFPGRVLHLEMHTRRKGEDGAYMGDLQVTGRTLAESIEEAAALVTRGREMAIMVALATNCAISPLEAELVYEVTPDTDEREFFQRFVPDDQISYADRVVPMDATSALLSCIAQHSHRDRLVRAISQYSEALSRWENGSELLSLSHLFMGVEAIKKACWRNYAIEHKMAKEEIANQWGFKDGGRLTIDDFLDQEARIRLVFKNDRKHHRIAKDTSDSFEHGFANGGGLFKAAAASLVPTANYLREAIIDISGLEPEHRETLLGDKYSSPRGPAGLEQYFRGVLKAPVGVRLAADDQDHPFCIWQIEINARKTAEGTHEYEHKPTMTPIIGPGVTLQPLNHEVWARGTFKPKPASDAEI